MNVPEVARKIKRAIGRSPPVMILIRETPAGMSVTIRCLPAATTPQELVEKWRGWVTLGVFDYQIEVQALEDDIDFLITKGELHG